MILINPLQYLKTWRKEQNIRVKTPTVIQMEAVECGAAALGIILGFYGRIVPLAELRQECGVSRDGSKASNVVKAARNYGMVADGFRKSLESLKELRPPYIVFWNFNHFLVVEGLGKDRVYLNDPGSGPRTVSHQEFDEGYTGIVLVIEPDTNFKKGGRKPSVVLALRDRLRGSARILLYCILAGFLLVVPNLVVPVFSKVFVDNILVEGRLDWLPMLLGGIFFAVGLQGFLTLMQLRYLRGLKIKLSVGMSSRFVWHVLRLPLSFYAQRFAGEISSRVRLNDEVADVLSGRLTTTVIDMVMVIFYALIMFSYDWVLTLVIIFFAAVNVLTLQFVSRQRVDTNMRLSQEYGKVSGVAIAGLQSIETLKASGLESDFFSRWAGYYTKAINAQQELGTINQGLGVLPSLLSALSGMFLLVVGGWRVINGDLSIGTLVAFQLLMQSFLEPVNNLVRFASTLQDLEGNLNRLDDVLCNSVDPEIKNWEAKLNQDKHLINSELSSDNFRLQGYIDLKDITFGYSRVERPLIEKFNLSIKPGQRVAFVGGSGSGKSTLAKIVAGLYEAWEGEVYFDGTPRSQISRPVLTNSIAVVEQEISLIAGTIRENLTLWDTTISNSDLVQACQDAAIHDIILSIPGGYDAQLIEGAVNLSGGQRQRLEIARALVNNPSILIMDEATSALDTETEKIIDQNLRTRGCTCIIVAHRLSTIRDCDEIIVLERGKVVQRGNHEELWQQEGYYSRLIRSEGG